MNDTVSLLPATCALCFRPFGKRGGRTLGYRCDKCMRVVCRPDDRACWWLHLKEAH